MTNNLGKVIPSFWKMTIQWIPSLLCLPAILLQLVFLALLTNSTFPLVTCYNEDYDRIFGERVICRRKGFEWQFKKPASLQHRRKHSDTLADACPVTQCSKTRLLEGLWLTNSRYVTNNLRLRECFRLNRTPRVKLEEFTIWSNKNNLGGIEYDAVRPRRRPGGSHGWFHMTLLLDIVNSHIELLFVFSFPLCRFCAFLIG